MIKGIGLALGGGAVKGFFHIGVLRVLKQEKIPIGAICGTSMGAIIGGLYSLNENMEKVEDTIFGNLEQGGFKQLSKPDKKHLPFDLKGYMDIKKMEQKMRKSLPDKDIKDTKIPFIAVATDLSNGREVVIKEGPMKDVLAASSSVPGILPPIKIKDKYLVDGIMSDNVPVRALRETGARKILAVHVMPSISFQEPPKGQIDVLLKCFLLTLNKISLGSAEEADLLIESELGMIPYADFRYARLCADIGEKAARQNLEKIKKMAGILGFLFKLK
jgi:NTE family protein